MIKHGRRIPRGAFHIPRKNLLRKIRLRETAPVAPTTGAQLAMAAAETREISYRVAVSYQLASGAAKTFNGGFLARNAAAAEEQGRGFVLRYIRPAQITGVVSYPIE